jgi:hypothetical protein
MKKKKQKIQPGTLRQFWLKKMPVFLYSTDEENLLVPLTSACSTCQREKV